MILALAACAPPSAGGNGGAPAAVARASDFSLRSIDGHAVRLSDYAGKDVVLLNFWATWCGPCAGEMPHLQRLYEKYKSSGFVVLAISMDGPESIAQVGPQARRHGVMFPVLLDEETRVVGTYNPKRAAPYNVLIDRSGAIAKTREGYSAGDEIDMENDIQALLGAPLHR